MNVSIRSPYNGHVRITIRYIILESTLAYLPYRVLFLTDLNVGVFELVQTLGRFWLAVQADIKWHEVECVKDKK